MVTVTKSWICPTCHSTVSTPYCPACGESPPSARDLTLHGLFAQLFRAFSNIDSRLMRSVRCLVTRPGVLPVAYVQGQRMPYIGPLQLFLLANVLFFALQARTNTPIVSSALDSHLHHQDWWAVAQRLVAHRLETRQTTLALYAPLFDRAIVWHAKSCIIVMVLPFALLLPLLFARNQQPFVAHVVFALHFYGFLLLLFCVALVVVAVDVVLGGAGLHSARTDKMLSLINLAVCALYLYSATGTVYGARGGTMRVIKVLVLAVAVTGILLGYRFVLLLITLYTT